MPGSTAVSSSWTPSPSSSRCKRNQTAADIDDDVVAATNPHRDTPFRSRKQRRTGPAPTTMTPRTLPMQPHEELLQELNDKYEIATASIISSSKIEKKATAVLTHLGRVDMLSAVSRPGVMMLHARAGDASKMVTVMELAKRRMGESGVIWYQYNRVYEVENPQGGSDGKTRGVRAVDQTAIEDTLMGGDGNEEDDEDDGEAFEPVHPTNFELAVRDKSAVKSKITYMSMFLSRIPIPELKAKTFITLQTNSDEVKASRMKV